MIKFLKAGTAKTPIKTPQKHRLMWNHDNLYAENKRCREKSIIPSNIFTNNFVKVNFLVNFAVVSEEYGKSNYKAI